MTPDSMAEVSAVPLLEILVQLLAGLGLFFGGIRMFSDNLRRLADHRLQTMIARMTSTGRGAAMLGLIGGALLQSMNAMVFVLISLVRAGILEVRRAHPVINYANLGSSALVLLAAFKYKLLILPLVGIAGIIFYAERDRSGSLGHAIRALMGIGLLFLGLTFIKDLGMMVSRNPWLASLITGSGSSLIIAFAMGSAIAFLVHSASSVTIVTMALAGGGVVDLEHAMLAVYGAALGVAVSTLAIGAGQRGLARQLILYQFSLKLLGLVVMLPLFALEFVWGVPLLAAGLDTLPGTIALHVALIYLVYQLSCDLAMEPLHGRVATLIERQSPQTSAEELGQMRYLYPGAELDPGTALVLVDREQQRMIELMPAYVDDIRSEVVGRSYELEPLHQGCGQVVDVCQRFLEGLLASDQSKETMAQTLVLHHRNQLLVDLQESLHELVLVAKKARGEDIGEAWRLIDTLVESIHVLLLTLNDAVQHGRQEDLVLLRGLTGDRSEMMDSIRRRLLGETALEPSSREALIATMTLFERLVWLLRRYALLLAPDNHDGEPVPA